MKCPMRPRALAAPLALALLSSTAWTQGFNVDVGDPFLGSPAATYGAGAGQVGTWNGFDPIPTGGQILFDLSGGISTVTLDVAGTGGGSFNFDNTATTGDDELLMDDLQDLGLAAGPPVGEETYTFANLTPGVYTVYTYAWAPDNPLGFRTEVSVVGSADPPQTLFGNFTGTLVEGMHYAKHVVDAPTGQIDIYCDAVIQNGSVNGIQIVPGGVTCGGAVSYCTAKVNSLGCTPTIGFTGSPSASGGTFTVDCNQMLNNKPGIMFYGLAQAAIPFQGGILCVQPPIKRTAPQSSGGNPPPNDCSGTYSFDMNALIQGGTDPNLVQGAVIDCQYWSRDPQSPSTTSLSDALEFTICN